MFAVMKDREYATNKIFIYNFMNDWRMVLGKNHVIKKFELCDFTAIYEWHMKEKEKKKQKSTEVSFAIAKEALLYCYYGLHIMITLAYKSVSIMDIYFILNIMLCQF